MTRPRSCFTSLTNRSTTGPNSASCVTCIDTVGRNHDTVGSQTMDKGTRGELLDRLAGASESATPSHPLRVAVDGGPAAGKTTLADELARLLRTRGRQVIRATT